MTRSRFQKGRVVTVGKRQKKWYGHYYLYVKDETQKETRKHKSVVLGDKAHMRK